MKLETLHEAKLAGMPNVPYAQEFFSRIKQALKPDLTLDEFARFLAKVEYDIRPKDDFQWVIYNGLPGLKNNPKEMEDVVAFFFDSDESEEDIEDIWKALMKDAANHFRGQPTRVRR